MKKLICLFLVLVSSVAFAADQAINARTELATTPASNDILPIYDTSATAGKRITVGNLLGGVQPLDSDLTTIAGLTPAENKVMIGSAAPAWSVSAYTLAAPGTAGAVVYSDGINWTRSATPAFQALTLTGTATLSLGTSSSAIGQLLFKNATNANAFTIQPGVTGAALSWTLPTAAPGGANYLLNVDADGTMGYTDPAGLGGGYSNLTSFVDQTAWRVFYSDGSGDVKELALGSDGEYLKSNGASSAPTWATPAGAAHDAITLSTDLGNNLLGLSTQQLTLDNQTANYVFAGATSGGAAAPAFRALVAADMPATVSTVSASQAEMEAGTETALRSVTPQRVKQAIDALAPLGWDYTARATAPSTPVAGKIYRANNEAGGWDPISYAGTTDYFVLYTGSSYIGVIDIDGNLLLTGLPKLSSAAYAATTSAELAGVLSDENATSGFMTNPMTTAGDLITGAASGASTARIAAVAAGQPLMSGGVATAPAYAGYTFSGTAAQTYTFPSATSTLATLGANTFTGTQALGANNITMTGSLGATGAGKLTKIWSVNGEFTNTPTVNGVAANAASGLVLNPMSAAGDLLYGGASGAATRLAVAGQPGYLLTSGTTAGGTTPLWQAPGASGTFHRGAGTTTTPTWSTSTLADTYAQGTLLTAATANTVTGSSTPTLGLAGTTGGTLEFANATSGTIKLSPTTGALASSVITMPAYTGTAVVAATSTTTTQALFATATAGAPAFRALAAGDLPATLSSGTAITNASLTTPAIGAATGTSLMATGRVDGTVGMVLSTAGSPTTISSTDNKASYYMNQGNSAANSIFTLPTAAAGLQYCIKNYTGITTVLKFQTSASGQYIDLDGVNTASGGLIKSAGAAGDGVCVVGVDSTHWVAFPNKGTWTKD